MFFIKTREHENKRGGWRLAWAKREHEVWLGFAQHSLLAYPQLTMFFVKTREHENKRGGWRLDWAKRKHEVGFAQHSFLPVSSLKPLDFSLFTLRSSLKPLDSSLFTFHSSLKPLDSSLFVLHSSLPLRFAQPPHNHLHLSCGQPFNVLLVSLFHECVVQLGATFNPHHQSVYCHVWVGRGEVEEGKLLLGVWL